MRQWSRSRLAVVLFIAIGVVIALVLLLRDLGGDEDVPDQDGTLPALAPASAPA